MDSKVSSVSEVDYRLLRAEEVAKILALGRATVYSLMASGELPTFRCGRSVRVPNHRLRDWIESRASSVG